MICRRNARLQARGINGWEHKERGNWGIKDASDEALDRNNILAQDEGGADYLKT